MPFLSRNLPFYLLLCCIYACTPIPNSSQSTTSTPLQFDNRDYTDLLGTVLLSPSQSDPSITDPITSLGTTLTLNFDLLTEEYEFLRGRIIHCTKDWIQSRINELEFLPTFNDFAIDNFTYSFNTLQPYVQYSLQLPRVSVSGNYLLVVYRDGNRNDLVLSRRFVIYEEATSVQASIQVSRSIPNSQSHQRVSFDIDYAGINIFNPFQDLSVVLLQNHSWPGAITGLQPTLTRPDRSELEYRHFDGKNEFPGLNEFRFFDARATQFRGVNIASIRREGTQHVAYLEIDKPRGGKAYSRLFPDRNGDFSIENRDPGESLEETDYIYCWFTLESEKQNQDIYVQGKFNDWQINDQYRMIYDYEKQQYRAIIKLKQGLYDYRYVFANGDQKFLEGNFRETENNYEILVYYRDPTKGYDQIIGYQTLSAN